MTTFDRSDPRHASAVQRKAKHCLKQFKVAVKKSPVLTELGCEVTLSRGRFNVIRSTAEGTVHWGRITPLAESNDVLLECAGRGSSWYEVAKGRPGRVIKSIADDCVGTFHGLGAINQVLRGVDANSDCKRSLVKSHGTPTKPSFRKSTGSACPAQVALAFYFGIPIQVLIEPREYYAYHRAPRILEYSPDRTHVLVQFSQATLDSTIVGVCLYVKHSTEDSAVKDNEAQLSTNVFWEAYTIRPNASASIAEALAWLAKTRLGAMVAIRQPRSINLVALHCAAKLINRQGKHVGLSFKYTRQTHALKQSNH